MSDNCRAIEPIPETFSSYEEAAEFWDTHDTTDYLEDFETVSLEESELRNRRFEVSIDEDLRRALHQKAERQGIGVEQLVNSMLRSSMGDVA